MTCDLCPFVACGDCQHQGTPDWEAAFERAGWPELTPEDIHQLRNEDE